MIKSMTAFGRARETVNRLDVTVELRSVNNRYLDCTVRLPRTFSFLEEKIKPYLQAKGIKRGKLEVAVTMDAVDTPEASVSLDEKYAQAYIAALRRLGERFDLRDDISVMTVAQNRDLFTVVKPEEDADRDWEALRTVLDRALDAFLAGRLREGENIRRDLCEKLEGIRTMVCRIEVLSADDTVTYREKLEGRLREILSDNRITFEESRILTECAIFADRIAIDEELVRLRSHFDGFEEILAADEPAGRKLDFLIQEINREVNTIGSKCQNSAIARIVVDIKCEIEKLREQVQNLE